MNKCKIGEVCDLEKKNSEMKILMILPRIRPTLEEDNKYNYTFPLGLSYISSIMKQNDYNVDCLNLNHDERPIEKIMEDKLKNNYDIVATGHIWMGYYVVKIIVETTRLHSPKSKIILGGSLVSSDLTTIMRIIRPDYVVKGEGEATIIELLKCIKENKEPKDVKGIAYFIKNILIENQNREPINNIDELPLPDLDGFGFNEYLSHMYPNQMYQNNLFDFPRTYPILAGRGCPFSCTFCYHSIGKRYRERSIDSVIDEIKYAIKKYAVNVINIYDDTFAIKKERVYEFCDKIKELNIKWSCQLTVKNIDKELLEKMKESGCFVISYGFESYDKKILKSMKKPITPEEIDFAIKTTLEVGIAIQGNFLFGDIAETKETARITLEYWKNNCKGQINLNFVQPYAGSELYNKCLEKNIIENKIGYMSFGIFSENFFNMADNMTNQEIQELLNMIMILRSSGYYKHTTPKLVQQEVLKDKYIVMVECPFCHKDITYKNYFFKLDTWNKDFMICRDCMKRFYITKPIM